MFRKLGLFRKPEKKHWTQIPKNRDKVMEVSRAMQAGRRRKRELAHN